MSLREAALSGLGIVNLPTYLVSDDLRSGRLASVLEGHVPVERAIYAVYPQAPFIPTRVRELVRHLVEGFAPAPHLRRATAGAPRTGVKHP
ncbi:LysR substrate-binding domain-containing protein [Sorangium sp. So ce315]|uniref:LysR substrate-binding domain-containing protein n=1 Tax=Sorangium sp. So ce315 TaxID=3133299 RepID=UPI003F5E3EBA